MGSTSSKKQKDGNLYNKDVDAKRKLLTGFHMSKDNDGIQANFQIAFWKKTHKKYEKVPLIENEEKPEEEEDQNILLMNKQRKFSKCVYILKSYCGC